MAERKIIAVAGATGAQGGGLVRAILADPQRRFAARALTRNPASESARALAAAGAEVVAADVNDEASLRRAFAGAHGAFCVTFFWADFSPEHELAQAGHMARASVAAGVQHVIWSTLEDTRRWVPLSDDRMPTLMGRYKVPHFDAKGEANALFTQAGAPTTLLHTSFYWDNMIFFGSGPKPGPDGQLALVLPMGDRRLPGIASEDIGKCALGIFAKGQEYIGQSPGIAGEMLTGTEMAAQLARALGRPVRYVPVTPEAYRGFGFPGADDLGNMFQFKAEFNADYCGARSLALSRALNPDLMTFERWLDRYAARIPLE